VRCITALEVPKSGNLRLLVKLRILLTGRWLVIYVVSIVDFSAFAYVHGTKMEFTRFSLMLLINNRSISNI
jgi:hypothetical protein